MTCIVGVEHKGHVYLGADSAGVDGRLGAGVHTQAKLFRVGGAFVGGCGSFRVLQVVRKLSFEDHGDVWESIERFVDAYRAALKGAGCLEKDKEIESPAHNSDLLVGLRDKLFRVQSDFAYLQRVDGFDSVGCAADLALGSLFSNKREHPLKRLEDALICAARFSAGVRPPFTYDGNGPGFISCRKPG